MDSVWLELTFNHISVVGAPEGLDGLRWLSLCLGGAICCGSSLKLSHLGGFGEELQQIRLSLPGWTGL